MTRAESKRWLILNVPYYERPAREFAAELIIEMTERAWRRPPTHHYSLRLREAIAAA